MFLQISNIHCGVKPSSLTPQKNISAARYWDSFKGKARFTINKYYYCRTSRASPKHKTWTNAKKKKHKIWTVFLNMKRKNHLQNICTRTKRGTLQTKRNKKNKFYNPTHEEVAESFGVKEPRSWHRKTKEDIPSTHFRETLRERKQGVISGAGIEFSPLMEKMVIEVQINACHKEVEDTFFVTEWLDHFCRSGKHQQGWLISPTKRQWKWYSSCSTLFGDGDKRVSDVTAPFFVGSYNVTHYFCKNKIIAPFVAFSLIHLINLKSEQLLPLVLLF